MAYVSIVEAVRLTKKSRSTISRYVKQGKLSKTPNGIDVAELIRVFGELEGQSETSTETNSNQSDDALTQFEIELMEYTETLESDIKMLQKEIRELHDKYDKKEDRLLNLIENRLTDQRKGFFKRLFN